MNKPTNNYYLTQTPKEEREEFIRFLHKSGFAPIEIRRIYRHMNKRAIDKILRA